MWVTRISRNGCDQEGRGSSYSSAELAGMTAGLNLGLDGGVIALYQKCPHLGCRVPECVDVAVVRVPVPRVAVQPGRGEAGRPGPSGHGPLRDVGRLRRVAHGRHRHDYPGPRDRYQHDGSRSRRPQLHRPVHALVTSLSSRTHPSSPNAARRLNPTNHRPRHLGDRPSSVGSSTSSSTSGRPSPRWGRRSSWPPTAVRAPPTSNWKARRSIWPSAPT